MIRGVKISSEGMAITVANGPVKLVFASHRKEETNFVLRLELKLIQYNDTTMTMPMADEKKTKVLMNHSKQSEKKWNFYARTYKK